MVSGREFERVIVLGVEPGQGEKSGGVGGIAVAVVGIRQGCNVDCGLWLAVEVEAVAPWYVLC